MKTLTQTLTLVLLSLSIAFASELETSLRGSQIDGGFTVQDGLFYPDRNALDLFDYFMTLNGEQPFEAIQARVMKEIDARLDGQNAKAARDFWQTYLGYLDEIHTVERVASAHEATYVWDMAQQQNDLWQLRRAHFGDAIADRLFADDEAVDSLKLARLEARNQKMIDPLWRAEIQALEADQPEAAKVAFDRATLPSRIRAFTEGLRAQGLSEAEIEVQRAEAFGVEVNERLSKLEARRAAWQARIDSLVSEVDMQSNKRRLTPVERRDLTDEMVSKRFETEAEQVRARAILRMRGEL